MIENIREPMKLLKINLVSIKNNDFNKFQQFIQISIKKFRFLQNFENNENCIEITLYTPMPITFDNLFLNLDLIFQHNFV